MTSLKLEERYNGHVKIDVRPPVEAEGVDYFGTLPFANGLPSWEPAGAAWHGGPEPWPAPKPPATAEHLELLARRIGSDKVFHPVAAFVDDKLVGGSATLSLEVTVPGLRFVPIAGVTATGVSATHRRLGLLRKMMQVMFEGALERNEPISMLSASEGGIYGRFGFSPATYRTRWEIERSEAALRQAPASGGSLELVDATIAREAWPVVHDSVRHHRIGELSARPSQWTGLSDESIGTDGPLRYVLHRDDAGAVDGIANFRLPWSRTVEDAGTLIVEDIRTTTPAAYRALWGLLLDFDLTRKVVAPARPRDEPLRWMLENPRAMRVTRQSENLWMRLLDLPTALESRSYTETGELVIEVREDHMCPSNLGRWLLAASPDGSSCAKTTRPADLTVDIQSLGSLYLGGMSADLLAAADRIVVHRPTALRELSKLFRSDPEPYNSFVF